MLAHGVHAALVVAGLAGLGSLLAPTISLGRRTGSRPAPRTAHDVRVGALRAAVAAYAAEGRVTDLVVGPARPVRFASSGSTLLLPLALTGTVAAAGVHAAMVPSHLRERALLGAFFVGCALLQPAWAGRALGRPTRRWLVLGAAGNLALVGLWAATRTTGLPLGLLPAPEPVGTWDAACVGLELVAATACLLAARRRIRRVAPWRDWHAGAHAWLALAATLLVVLSLGGGH